MIRFRTFKILSALISVALLFDTTAKSFAVEAVKPPMPASRKAALDAPKLIPVDSVKTYVNGLSGFVNASDKSATLRGRVPNVCVQYLSLQAPDQASEAGAIPFALMGTSQALKCLKDNVSKCTRAESADCSDFEKLSKDAKTMGRFHPSVTMADADPKKFKVTLAKSAMMMNDKTVKIEAVGDCCDIDVATGSAAQAEGEKPIKDSVVQILGETKDALSKAAEDARKQSADLAAKRKKSLSEDDDDPTDDPEAKRNAARDPTLARVATDKEMEEATAKNMAPFYQQYYSNLMQAQQFNQNVQMQNLMFQMKTQMGSQQTPSLANSWMTNYSPMQTLGNMNSGFNSGLNSNYLGLPSLAPGGFAPTLMTPTLTMPTFGAQSR
jgi:hypothetical protein